MRGGVHPVVRAAARGELPPWAKVTKRRYEHVGRVAALLDDWAAEAGLDDRDRERWRAAGYLHDAVKDEDPESLRDEVPREQQDIPAPVLHGPAAAARLRCDGVEDLELLAAITWHTLGHATLGFLGRALYCADFLEPGRKDKKGWRAARRARMPGDLDEVTKEVLRKRLLYLVKRGRTVRPETMGFWNRMAEGEAWARASEV